MPIDVTCPKCNLILPAPDEYAGKRIRCAECDTIVDVPVPGAETVEVPTTFPRRRRDDDDGGPVRRRRRDDPKPRNTWRPWAIGGAIAAIAAIAVGGAAIWYLNSRTEQKPNPDPIPAPQPNPSPTPSPPTPPLPKPTPPEPKPTPPEPKPKPPEPKPKTPPTFRTPASPSTITGLRVHFPFDSKTGSATFEAISAKAAGKLADGTEVVDGKRGKALKIPIPPRGPVIDPFGLDLSDLRDRFKIESNAAATYTIWANTADTTRISPVFSLGQDRTTDRPRIYFSALKYTGSAFVSTDSLNSQLASLNLESERPWHHYAIRRTAAGIWSFFVDGTSIEWRRPLAANRSKHEFTRVGIGAGLVNSTSTAKPFVIVDDLCVFNRDLADSEIARLAGKD
jgi:hypothetical protein